MKIIADKNILSVENGFGQYGELCLVDGRKIQREDLRDADALLVRSVTVVDESLLRGSNIKFVGTATSGTDHIDLAYLEKNEIHFADAKGSNANAVVEYCFAALAYAVLNKKLKIENCEVGIIGGGKVGGLFASKLAAMHINYRVYDPFLAMQNAVKKSDSQIQYSTLEEVLQCDVVSLHVPLTKSGKFPTENLLDAEKLHLLQDGALLINTSRGGVVDEAALRQFLQESHDVSCVFDVWNREPKIDQRSADQVDIATPHIAGYSQEAKTAATGVLRQAFQMHFKLGEIDPDGMNERAVKLSVNDIGKSEDQHWAILLAAFPIDQLSLNFKQAIKEGEGSAAFERIRQQFLGRREFKSMTINAQDCSKEQTRFLCLLGFNFAE
ncbi:MAG: 4-phosphoerythronate dehydrogenase [Pseudohongiella sp.]|jgi:erythronate-4-phosphate dehydrogenase|nr:4-phosphoerythronate dehydrogenase [Pseudohongiella sp.]